MDLAHTPWIPVEGGDTLSLHAALTDPDTPGLDTGYPMADAAVLRLLALMDSRADGDPAGYLDRHAARLELFGPHPFLQVPAALTEDLPWTNLAEIITELPSGRSSVTLRLLHDALPTRLPVAEAALHLIRFQFAAPAKGNTRRGYSRSSPGASVTCFHAHGRTLQHDLRLNRPEQPGSPPTWEVTPDWDAWTRQRKQGFPLDSTRSSAFPWRTVTLDQPHLGTVRRVRQAAGPSLIETTADAHDRPDPHTCLHTRGHTSSPLREDPLGTFHAGELHPLRNPPNRDLRGQLLHALIAAHRPDSARAPVSFRRALKHGATRVSASGLSTNKAVVYEMLSASFPWPAPGTLTPDRMDALLGAFRNEEHLKEIVSPLVPYTESHYPRAYWDAQQVTLDLSLSGQLTAAETTRQLDRTTRQLIDGHLTALIAENPPLRREILLRYSQYRRETGDPVRSAVKP